MQAVRMLQTAHVPHTTRARTLASVRRMSSWTSEESEQTTKDQMHEWPIEKANTILNICPQAHHMVVERLGSLHRVHSPGYFFTIPILDRIQHTIDMRERTVFYPPQSAITKDNVAVRVNAVLFVQFVEPLKAAYGATDPLRSIKELAISAMRAAVGEMELDQVFHNRQQVNDRCCSVVKYAAADWGMVVTRHEIQDVTPDRHIADSLDKQAAAERFRREQVLQAEGSKQAAALESEGVKIQLTNESEGHLIRVRNEALAEQARIELEAEGRAKSITRIAEAHAHALESVAKALEKEGANEAARLDVAREYINMYANMGKESNTVIMNERPADLTALFTQASLALDASKSKRDSTTAN